MTLIRTRLYPELPTLRETIDRLFDESFVPSREWVSGQLVDRPAIDAYATPESFVVKVAVPGVKPEDVHATVTGDLLHIEGSYREEEKREEKGYLYREMSRGEIRRSVTLPAGLKTEDAKASYADGVLTLTFPKVEEAKPREITVQAA